MTRAGKGASDGRDCCAAPTEWSEPDLGSIFFVGAVLTMSTPDLGNALMSMSTTGRDSGGWRTKVRLWSLS